MLGLLADVHARAHLRALLLIFTAPRWREIWSALDVHVHTFRSLGLDYNASDAEIWRVCQQDQLLLLTSNRNQDGADSLESTIRTSSTIQTLPVLTMADPDRVLADAAYTERVAVRLMEIVMDIERHRGTGRLYLP